MSFADKTLTCRDCGVDFVFTSGEQEFYAQKGFTNEPTRCPSCRQQRKTSGGGRGYSDRNGYGRNDSYERAIRKPDLWYHDSDHAVLIRSNLVCHDVHFDPIQRIMRPI
jgi:hypothetical protein